MSSNVKHFDPRSFNGFIVNRAYYDAALHAAVAGDLGKAEKSERIYEAIQHGVNVAASGQLTKIIESEVLKPWIKHTQIMVIQSVLDSSKHNRMYHARAPGRFPC